jgi:AcrR family transcriptional regulator
MPKLSQAKLDRRRGHILAAAARCFDRAGFHRTTIADIRREAGVSTGAIYTYFPTKEAIVRALLEDAQRARRSQLQGTSALQARVLQAWAEAVFTQEGRHVARVDVQLWAEALRDPAIGKLARGAVRGANDVVTEVLARAPGMPRELDARAAAALLTSIGLGLEVQRAIGVPLDGAAIAKALGALFAPYQPAADGRRRTR